MADLDILGPFSYQWDALGVDISGATSNTFVLTQAQVGSKMRVTIKYTDGQGNPESVSSAQTAIVTHVNTLPSGLVTISGKGEQYQTLTANNTLADVDGLAPFSYQWTASGVNIADATNTTFVLTQAQMGKNVGVTIRYTDGQGNLESKSSDTVYVLSSKDFVFKMATTVWNVPATKTYPFDNSYNYITGLSYLTSLVDSSQNTQVIVTWTNITDNGSEYGIHCNTQLFNSVKFSSIVSFEITQFGNMPLSRGSSISTGIFADFKGKISATDAPVSIPKGSLAYAFANSSA